MQTIEELFSKAVDRLEAVGLRHVTLTYAYDRSPSYSGQRKIKTGWRLHAIVDGTDDSIAFEGAHLEALIEEAGRRAGYEERNAIRPQVLALPAA